MFNTINNLPTHNQKFETTSNKPKQSFLGQIKTNNNLNKDIVSFSSAQYQQYTPANIYPAFKVAFQNVVNNLINAVDGMIPYPPTAKPSWQAFPQRNSHFETPGSKKDLSLNGEHTYNKTVKDGGIDYRESTLGANQLKYDSMTSYPQGTEGHQETNDASLLLNSLFQGPVYGANAYQIRPEFDVNRNGLFDVADAQVLACLDGNPNDLSNNDLNIASTNFVMNQR